MFRFELGVQVADKLAESEGYGPMEGIVIGRVEYASGCPMYLVSQRHVSTPDEHADKQADWLPEDRLARRFLPKRSEYKLPPKRP